MADPIIDALSKPAARPLILWGDPYGEHGAWTVGVEYTAPSGRRETHAQLTEWRARA